MSLIFLLAVLFDAAEEVPLESITPEFFIAWALFAIADAQWVRVLFNRGGVK
jgi:hypothetical protein